MKVNLKVQKYIICYFNFKNLTIFKILMHLMKIVDFKGFGFSEC